VDRTEDQPYCKECGYLLVGLTESSKCPECGRPIVEVLVRDSFPGRGGYRFQTQRRVWGLPLVSIASGPRGAERMGKPVGIIAIGGRALGVIAVGGFAAGGITFGGFSLGLLAIGGFALGGLAIGGFAAGACAIGGQAFAILFGFGGRVTYLRPW